MNQKLHKMEVLQTIDEKSLTNSRENVTTTIEGIYPHLADDGKIRKKKCSITI